jgi:predicted TIM-barrel fold metal-dependent hydrolase
MTVSSDKDYFSKNPRYHMHLHKEFPSYEEQLKARDRVLNKHPDLRFIGLHLASLEWSVDKLAHWLVNYPNAGVDLAERVCHLQFQSIDNHQKVKEFIEHYQDRIIYGSDQIDDGSMDADEIQNTIRTKWRNEFRFFADGDIQTAWNVDKPFKGMGLNKKILKKIFRDNALTYYNRLSETV